MGLVWDLKWMSMGFLWYFHGIPMGILWHSYGIHDMSMVFPWDYSRTAMESKLNSSENQLKGN